jgi:serine/threonine protein phosphatase PrpC
MLCSDGVHASLTHEAMTRLMQNGGDQAAAAALVQSAIESGSKDNVTAVICTYEDEP